jgi:hypothetical protein
MTIYCSIIEIEENSYISNENRQNISKKISKNFINHVNILSEVSKMKNYISYSTISNLPLWDRDTMINMSSNLIDETIHITHLSKSGTKKLADDLHGHYA